MTHGGPRPNSGGARPGSGALKKRFRLDTEVARQFHTLMVRERIERPGITEEQLLTELIVQAWEAWEERIRARSDTPPQSGVSAGK